MKRHLYLASGSIRRAEEHSQDEAHRPREDLQVYEKRLLADVFELEPNLLRANLLEIDLLRVVASSQQSALIRVPQ